MKLEDQVCSLPLAKRLKELGVKQESAFYWFNDLLAARSLGVTLANFDEGYKSIGSKYGIWLSEWNDENSEDATVEPVSAFTVAELGEMLPANLITQRLDVNTPQWVTYFYDSQPYTGEDFEAATEADARAKMLIYLIENGLLKENSNG